MIAGSRLGIDPESRSGDIILIVCEGSKTEPFYFKFLCEQLSIRTPITIDTNCGTDPLSVVDRALELKKAAEIKAKHGPVLEFDQIWCVFDHEALGKNPKLAEGIDKADSNGLNIAISNPCVELWFLLHYGAGGGYHDCAAAMKALRKENKQYKKGGFAYESLSGQTGEAIQFAQRLRADQLQTSNSRWPNPCTSIDKLVLEIVKIGSPELRKDLGISNS